MRFFFTRSDLIGSKLIRWGLDEEASHLAIGFGDVVVESRMETGFTMDPIEKFLARNTIVCELRSHDASPTKDDSLKSAIVQNCSGKKYDVNGIFWWSATSLLKRTAGIDYKGKNKWQSSSRYWCVEILRGTEVWLWENLRANIGKIDGLSPIGAYKALKSSPFLVDV